MERKRASDFPAEVLQLFNRYVHGAIGRREFLDRAGKFAVAGMTAAAMLESLRPNYAYAQQVPPKDARIAAEYVTYPSPRGSGTMKGYLVRPAKAERKLPGIVVVHENRGLNPYIEDVARRLAVENYLALAPDALTPLGGYPGDDEKAAQLFSELDRTKRTEDLLAAVPFLASRPECNGSVGAVGFCYGGGIVNVMAVRLPELAAAISFYGPAPPGDAATVKAALQLHHAGVDDFVNPGWPAWKTALDRQHVRYSEYTYPNTYHGFHNDTTPRYDEAAAKLAWSRTLAFFAEHLKR